MESGEEDCGKTWEEKREGEETVIRLRIKASKVGLRGSKK